MSKFNQSIWIWQTMLTPHVGALAESLVDYGYKVIFVANEGMSKERLQQGWKETKLGKATTKLAKNKKAVIRLVNKAPKNSIHICQGISNNGLVSDAQRILRKRGLRYWIMIEKIDDQGWKGKFKRLFYYTLFAYLQKYLEGVLAIGHGTKNWIISRGVKKSQVYSFAYFLKAPKISKQKIRIGKGIKDDPYRFVFIGQLIKKKKVDLLINAIAKLKKKQIELWIVGDGPERESLFSLANKLLPGQVYWFGTLPMPKVSKIIRKVDCLVLPSRYDGWGAVTSEALMVGTPVICSNKCGSSVVVKASRVGGVFPSNNLKSLVYNLDKQYKIGKISIKKKQQIAKWAKCLNSYSGAKYLDLIINNIGKKLIKAPWEK